MNLNPLKSFDLFNEKLDIAMNTIFFETVVYPAVRYDHQQLNTKIEELMKRDIPSRTYGLMQAYEEYFVQCEELGSQLMIDIQNIKNRKQSVE